jgi:hypothetical protein
MRVNPTGQSEYLDGNEVLRYGIDIGANKRYATWYHDGINGEAAWAMDTEVLDRLSISVREILVADANHGLYAIDVTEFEDSMRTLGGREQHYASANDDFVRKVTDSPGDVLQRHLWIESGNEVNEGYHKNKNEA